MSKGVSQLVEYPPCSWVAGGSSPLIFRHHFNGWWSYEPACHGQPPTFPHLNTSFSLLSVTSHITLFVMDLQLVKGMSPQFRTNYLRLIAAGHVESTALAFLEVDWLDFFEICSKDPEFRADIEEARKCRADKWIDNIAVSLDKKYYIEVEKEEGRIERHERPPNKDELGKDKLDFEKMKFLAQADNPEKYSPGAKPKISVEFDMADFKLLSPQESMTALKNDPFAKPTIDAESTVVKEKKDE